MAFVTILTPLFNGIEYFEECYTSIICQSEPNWTWIIGINGHGDDSNSIYNNLKQIISDKRIRVKNYTTVGKVDTLNAMMKDVITTYVALCDCDDIWYPNKLALQKNAIEIYPFIDVFATNCTYIGDHTGSPNLPFGQIDISILLNINPIINSSVIMKSNLAIWEDRFNLEDYDLWFRLALQEKMIFTIPESYIYHRIHRDSAFNNSGKQNVSGLLEYYKNKTNDVTVVSAYYPIKSKNSIEEYIQWLDVWRDIPCNLVFFTTPELVPLIENLRKNYIYKTKVIGIPFSELEGIHRYGAGLWSYQYYKDHEQNHTPELYIIWYEKKEFVKKAIDLNVFNTSKFVWCDAGICRNINWISKLKSFPRSDKILEDKFMVLRITDFEKEKDFQQINCVGGGVLAGTKEVWLEYYNKYDSMIQTYLDNNKFIGKDQSIIASMIQQEPNFFYLTSILPTLNDGVLCWYSLLFYLT